MHLNGRIIVTRLRFALASALMLCVQPPSTVSVQSSPESRARVTLKRIQLGCLCDPSGPSGQGSTIEVESSEVRVARVYSIRSTISDRIIATLPALTTRAALVKCRRNAPIVYKVSTMAKVIVLRYAHLLNWFRVSKGYTHAQYFFYCISSSLLSWATLAHGM